MYRYTNQCFYLYKPFSIIFVIFIVLSQVSCRAFPITHFYLENMPKNIDVIDLINFSPKQFKGESLSELSDLAWDSQQKLLYAISDTGRLFHFKFIYNQYKILTVKPVFATKLKNKKGKSLGKKGNDSEGLLLRQYHGKKELVVSFEGKAKVTRYTTKGKRIAKIALPSSLNEVKRYQSNNKMLEAITLHPKYGLISAPEYPFYKQNQHVLYSLDGQHQWKFKASSKKNSGITALEITPKQDILVLERIWQPKKALLKIVLKAVKLYPDNTTKVTKLASFQNDSNWPIDNFEGLTRLDNNYYLMVSDNGKTTLEQTLFMLFKLY